MIVKGWTLLMIDNRCYRYKSIIIIDVFDQKNIFFIDKTEKERDQYELDLYEYVSFHACRSSMKCTND